MKNLLILFFIFHFSSNSFSQDFETSFREKFKYYSISQFESGMKFMVEPKDYISNNRFFKYHKKGKGKKVDLNNFRGEIFVFKRIEERLIKCDKKDCLNSYIVFENKGIEYEFDTKTNLVELRGKTGIKSIPDFIFYNDFEKSIEFLLNKEFYLIKGINSNYKLNKLYTITKIEPNTQDKPIVITYKDSSNMKSYTCELRLSGTNESSTCHEYMDGCDFNKYFQVEKEYLEVVEIKLEKQKRIEQINKEIERSKKNKDSLIQEELELGLKWEKENGTNEEEKWEIFQSKCHYLKQGKDDYSNVNMIFTERYNLHEPNFNIVSISVQLRKVSNKKYVVFYTGYDLGCSSPYDNNKSYVQVKLQNNNILTFYHSGDLDCSDFYLYSELTNNDINKLKQSPIKSIRLNGTDYYQDIKSVKWKNFFIDKLNCIN